MPRGKAQGAAKKATGATTEAAPERETTAKADVEETPEPANAAQETTTSSLPDAPEFPALETKEPRKRGAYFAV